MIRLKKLDESKSDNYHDLEDLVYRTELTYDQIVDILDIKYFPEETAGYTLPPGIYEITDNNKTLGNLLRDIVKVCIAIDDIRLRSNSNIKQTLIFTEKYFFDTTIGFTLSHACPLNDVQGFIQLIPGKNKSDKPINITRIDNFF